VVEEAAAAKADDEVYHFISYVPVAGCLYELDGLKEGPINLGPCSDDDWLAKAAPAIQERIERYAASEIRFNLMAVIRNKGDVAAAELAALDAQRAALLAGGGDCGPALAALEEAAAGWQARKAAAAEQAAGWAEENVRRRHNYVPFIYHLCQLLAEKGLLKPLVDKARLASKERKKGGAQAMALG